MSAQRLLRSMTAGAFALAVFFSADLRADEPRAPSLPAPSLPAPSLPAPAGEAQRSAEPVSVPAFGDQNPSCLEWSDSCRVCARDAPGQAARCSTPGPVCQPGAIACTRR